MTSHRSVICSSPIVALASTLLYQESPARCLDAGPNCRDPSAMTSNGTLQRQPARPCTYQDGNYSTRDPWMRSSPGTENLYCLYGVRNTRKGWKTDETPLTVGCGVDTIDGKSLDPSRTRGRQGCRPTVHDSYRGYFSVKEPPCPLVN